MTSEHIFGVSIQPPDTCPMINSIQSDIKKALYALKGYERWEDIDELKSALEDIEYRLGSLDSELEDVRKNVEAIRAWGQEWKDICKQHETIILGEE